MKTLIAILVVGILNSQPTLANVVESSAKAGLSVNSARILISDSTQAQDLIGLLVSGLGYMLDSGGISRNFRCYFKDDSLSGVENFLNRINVGTGVIQSSITASINSITDIRHDGFSGTDVGIGELWSQFFSSKDVFEYVDNYPRSVVGNEIHSSNVSEYARRYSHEESYNREGYSSPSGYILSLKYALIFLMLGMFCLLANIFMVFVSNTEIYARIFGSNDWDFYLGIFAAIFFGCLGLLLVMYSMFSALGGA